MSAFTDIMNKIRAELADHAGTVEPLIAVLEVVQAATGLGGQSAATALKVIDAALQALEAQQTGVLTHDQLVQRLDELQAEARTATATIEAAQDVALSAKFPDPPPSTESGGP